MTYFIFLRVLLSLGFFQRFPLALWKLTCDLKPIKSWTRCS